MTKSSPATRKTFASQVLEISVAKEGSVWRRLYMSKYSDPLGFGYGPSRFSDPEVDGAPPHGFGVVYFGSSAKVCFAEAILRDRGVGQIGDIPIEWSELEDWTCASVQIEQELRLVDLRGDGLIRMGIPTDVARAKSHRLGRKWSRKIWEHPEGVDGLIYDSRLNGETNIAVYDRSLGKLKAVTAQRLIDCRHELAAIMDDFRLAVI